MSAKEVGLEPSQSVPASSPMGDAASWRLVFLASLGGTLEFFDFVVFGIFAKDIADAVFPAASPLASLMASFAAFAAGYLARPVGGVVLSHFGDRHGRRTVFLWSVFVMSAATFGMGLVPTFAAWGAAASATMVVLRVTQGFCLGGELPGALTYVVEAAPRRAPFVCAVVFACVTMGVAAATGVSVLVRTVLPAASVPLFGWRIAFMLGGLGGALGFALRRRLEESPEFLRLKQATVRQPFAHLLQTRPMHVVAGIALLAATACFNGLFFSHLPAYLSAVLHYDSRDAVLAQTLGVVASAAAMLAAGQLAMRTDPRLWLRAGALLLLAGAFPFYRAVASGDAPLTLFLVLAGSTAALVNGTFAVLLTDLFPTRVRFTGVALSFNVAFTVFSGMSPLVATSMIRSSGNPVAPAWLMVGAAVLTLAASLTLDRLGGEVLRASAVRGSGDETPLA